MKRSELKRNPDKPLKAKSELKRKTPLSSSKPLERVQMDRLINKLDKDYQKALEKKAKPRVRHDQKVVRAQIVLVRAGESTVAQAAREVGCDKDYLAKRIWKETRRDVLDRDGHLCVIRGCSDTRLEVHHRHNRAAGGTSDPLIAYGMANLITLCLIHHAWVTNATGQDRDQALSQGWLVLQTQNPENVAVWLFGRGFCWLNNDGGIRPVEEVA